MPLKTDVNDVFVQEKSFFHKVNERLSSPNIFILNNRWDASDVWKHDLTQTGMKGVETPCFDFWGKTFTVHSIYHFVKITLHLLL